MKSLNISLKISVLATALWSGTLAVLLTDIINEYTLFGTQQGLMGSAISIGASFALVLLIFFGGHFKKTHILIVFGLLTSVILLVQSFNLSFPFFLVACLVMGIGHGATDAIQSAFLADLNPDNRAKHMGALHGIFGIGAMLTPVALHQLQKSLDWHMIYMVVGFVCMVLILQFAGIATWQKDKVKAVTLKEDKLTFAGIKDFFNNINAWLVLFTMFFGAAAQSGIIIWTIRYVSVYLGSPEIAAISLSLFWISTTVSRFASPHIPLKSNQIIALGAFISAIVWSIALFTNQPIIICIACAIVGLASGSCIPLSLADGAAINPEKTGFSTSLLMIAKTFGQIISPILVAFIMAKTDMWYAMQFVVVMFLINALTAVLVKHKHVKKSEQTA